MRYLALLAFALMPFGAIAQDWEDRQVFGARDQPALRILSSTDTSFFAPIIKDFIKAAPNFSVEYFVTGTADLDRKFRASPDQFDVVISSAMDLQLKLANDGFAARLSTIEHPETAQWHDSLFAFTSEPAAIVINKRLLGDLPVPNSRQDLIELLRAYPERFHGKVGTYDVRQSGLGYLFATQDARASETYWRLMEVMGRIDARLYCCSGQMIDDLRAGDLAIAYNVLGSYAQARTKTSQDLLIILPSEFPTTMMRTVLASQSAKEPLGAELFIRHLLELQTIADPQNFPLPPMTPTQTSEGQATISLDPALMTYLDQMKRDAFIREWENAVVQHD
ncbi:extracellular solute-binding protein [Planktotalea sp.]|uniref:ABC transporter substrate-binding protein n=1 Tax=Planktotalea sp. TaxID=2029877 RepID=UPI00329A5D28